MLLWLNKQLWEVTSVALDFRSARSLTNKGASLLEVGGDDPDLLNRFPLGSSTETASFVILNAVASVLEEFGRESDARSSSFAGS